MARRSKKHSLPSTHPKKSPSRQPKRKSPPPPPPSPPPPKKPCLAPDHSLSEFTPYTILPSRSFSSRFRNPNLPPIFIPEKKKKLGVLEVDPKLYVACMADVATPKEAELKLPGMGEREEGEERLPGVREAVAEGVK
ncbi:hypothetical protein K440DRAFT_664007 [Wilcoxina mikolae CBS 423.85]|nr:hypothetical protein K440DRAFT_664007 [Wilcoxina mikolae CBS 423.85]